MIKRALVVSLSLAVLLCSVVTTESTFAAEDGVISGTVTNGTEDGNSLEGLEVTLWTSSMSDGNTTSDTIPVTINDEGLAEFEFGSLSAQEGFVYSVTVKYEDVDYATDWVQFAADETQKEVQLTVYETTTSDVDLVLHATQVIIPISETTFNVEEQYYFNNSGDLTYIGTDVDGTSQTLQFSLPEDIGINSIQYDNGLTTHSIVETSDGFADTLPIKPGMKSVFITYTIRYTSDSYDFSRTFKYDTNAVSIFVQDVADKDIKASGSSLLEEQSPTSLQDTPFLSLGALNVPANTSLDVTISGLSESGGLSTVYWILLAVGIAAIAGTTTGVILKRRRTVPQGNPPTQKMSSHEQYPGEKDKLLQELANLDDQFEAGEISQEEYEILRDKKKTRIMELVSEE